MVTTTQSRFITNRFYKIKINLTGGLNSFAIKISRFVCFQDSQQTKKEKMEIKKSGTFNPPINIKCQRSAPSDTFRLSFLEVGFPINVSTNAGFKI